MFFVWLFPGFLQEISKDHKFLEEELQKLTGEEKSTLVRGRNVADNTGDSDYGRY